MSRERVPRGEVLQAAYGVLDKFKLNRTFFVKTQQTDCETEPPVAGVVQEEASSTNKTEVEVEQVDSNESAEGVEVDLKKSEPNVIERSSDDENNNEYVVKPEEDFF